MSTHATIAKMNVDGSGSCIYCHHDGYLDGVGHNLKEFYYSEERVDALIELGDISSLAPRLDRCIAYHLDKKEPWDEVRSIDFKTKEELLQAAYDFCAEYLYIFTADNGWEIIKM